MCILKFYLLCATSLPDSPTSSLTLGGGVAVYVFDINQPSFPIPFYSVFVSVSVFMVLSTVK